MLRGRRVADRILLVMPEDTGYDDGLGEEHRFFVSEPTRLLVGLSESHSNHSCVCAVFSEEVFRYMSTRTDIDVRCQVWSSFTLMFSRRLSVYARRTTCNTARTYTNVPTRTNCLSPNPTSCCTVCTAWRFLCGARFQHCRLQRLWLRCPWRGSCFLTAHPHDVDDVDETFSSADAAVSTPESRRGTTLVCVIVTTVYDSHCFVVMTVLQRDKTDHWAPFALEQDGHAHAEHHEHRLANSMSLETPRVAPRVLVC